MYPDEECFKQVFFLYIFFAFFVCLKSSCDYPCVLPAPCLESVAKLSLLAFCCVYFSTPFCGIFFLIYYFLVLPNLNRTNFAGSRII